MKVSFKIFEVDDLGSKDNIVIELAKGQVSTLMQFMSRDVHRIEKPL